MTIAIRPARITELQAIQALERASGQRFVGVMDTIAADDPTDLDVLAARRAAGGLFVASLETSDGAVLAGFVMFRPLDQSLYIEQVDVIPAFERRGIGAMLIDAVAVEARSTGRARLTLWTFREVPWNAPYYRRLGFADIDEVDLTPGLLAVRREHLQRGLDETSRVFMARPL